MTIKLLENLYLVLNWTSVIPAICGIILGFLVGEKVFRVFGIDTEELSKGEKNILKVIASIVLAIIFALLVSVKRM
ncbi:hypothetical protein B7939_02025 [Eggerthia catenaformis]|nr:hypothetical protein B7939_02025 [Eggerthia catenaformis]